jgi:hypothetical protein
MPRNAVRSPSEIRRLNRQFDHQLKGLETVLRAMRMRGLTLHLHLDQRRGPLWTLSDGCMVPPETAALVIKNVHVVGVGDCLFRNALAQTYRYAEEEK